MIYFAPERLQVTVGFDNVSGRNASHDAQRLDHVTSHFSAGGAVADGGLRFLTGWRLRTALL